MSALYLICLVSMAVIPSGLVLVLSGWVVVRLARHYADGLEQLVLCVLCGQALLYAVQALVYMAGAPQTLVAAGVAVLTALSAAIFIADVRHGRVRPREYLPGLLAWFGLCFVLLAGATTLAVHGMPGTYWDWWEHYLRAHLFLVHQPPNTRIGIWSLASRGPLFNAVAAALMQFMGESTYWKFSIVATLVNAQVILPLALLLRQFVGLTVAAALGVGAVFLACAPFCNWNLTFTSPKMATTAGILAAMAFSLAGVRRREARLVAWGVFAVAVAFLMHYMAFLYAVVLLPALVYYAWRDKLAVRPIARAAGLGLGLAGVWMMFLVHEFGVRGALFSNSTLGSYAGWGADLKVKSPAPPSRIELVAFNLASTSLPVSLRALPMFECSLFEAPYRDEDRVSPSGKEPGPPEDRGLVFRIGVLDAAIGVTGLALLAAAAGSFVMQRLRSRPWPEFAGFWLYLVIVGLPVNIAAIGWYCVYGTLVQNLQPYVCLAAVFVVRWLLTLSLRWRIALGAAWLLECGIRTAYILVSQIRLLPLHVTPDAVVADEAFTVDGDFYQNYELKLRSGAVLLRDLVPNSTQDAVAGLTLLALGLLCFYLMSRPGKRLPP